MLHCIQYTVHRARRFTEGPQLDLTPRPAPAGRFVSVDGRPYHLIELGAGSPTLFLHGGGPGCTGWSDFGVVAPLFARTRRCLLPDLLQYGQSDKSTISVPMC